MYSFKRIFLITAGSLSLVLGVLGIFLPLLPTTPFLLLAGACYVRSSDKLYQWLIKHKQLGPFITSWKQGKGIPVKVKSMSIIFIWISTIFSATFVPIFVLKIFFFIPALFFTWLILKQKTFSGREQE
jgi:uncharacterized protein